MEPRSTPEVYDAHYYAHGCGTPYQRDGAWLTFFDTVAARITVDIAPSSVLDVGCAMGFLVEALRRRGVEAYGIDVSEYAISQVDPSVAAYCRVARATEPLSRRYGLVTCIEVLEHLGASEADEAVANIAAHTDDVLFSSTPFDYAEATHVNVQPPEYWAALFARHGLARDVAFDAEFVAPWTMRFRRLRSPWHRVVVPYERRLWELEQERHARRELAIALRNDLASRDDEVFRLREHSQRMTAERDEAADRLQRSQQEARVLTSQVRAWEERWRSLEGSMAWSVIVRLQGLRAAAAPPASRREHWLESGFWWARYAGEMGLAATSRKAIRSSGATLGRTARNASAAAARRQGAGIEVPDVADRAQPAPRTADVDIVVCVHDALPDVQRCLAAVERHTAPPFRLLLIDDGSRSETAGWLREHAAAAGADLVRNDTAVGYTRAANQGLAASTAPYVVLLNSDTEVGPEWLDRLVACAESDDRIGMVGPLSNTASWQSVPEVAADGDWAGNPLPDGVDVAAMARAVSEDAARLYPEMPFLNGFCLLIRRALLASIGSFDEETFGEGYGEENDFALRARAANWRLALADDVYVYHAQSRSYSDDRRRELAALANDRLIEKHGRSVVTAGVATCVGDLVLHGLRARSAVLSERRAAIAAGRERHSGRRVLFLLPTRHPGGGANIVLREARAMTAMGVAVSVFNLDRFREDFEDAYPDLELPVVYGRMDDVPRSLAEHVTSFDAMVATIYASVGALREVSEAPGGRALRYGYYVQDFEPYFFEPGSDPFHHAWQSYKLVDQLVRFTKTEWNRRELELLVGVDSVVVGPSYDIDLFRPRPRRRPESAGRALRVAAMIRPESPYRSPELTMRVLRDVARRFGDRVEVVLFGTEADDPAFRKLPRDFPARVAGILRQRQMAALLSETDIFVDFSTHQAMGLTALEAMACGVAVVVPERGGSSAFARNGDNALIVPAVEDACRTALASLIEDAALRTRISGAAIRAAVACHPEGPALAVLDALFRDPGRGS